jgi:class 3 adenylate cyclase/CHASE2 domain-containing sensor protein
MFISTQIIRLKYYTIMTKILTSTWAVCLTMVILLLIKWVDPTPIQSVKLTTFDSYQKFGEHLDSKSLVLLDLSDKALTKGGQWPWKRDNLGRVIIKAYRNGAALVVLQVVFAHKDRLGGDEMFLKMISKYPVILTETDKVKNLLSIERKALAIGNVDVPVDIDGTIRKLPLDNSIPDVILKVIKKPTKAKNNIWIDFRHHIPRIDITDKDWSSMKGKIVFIGTTFKGSTFVTTPNGLKNTHEIMAISTETLLSGKFISRPDWLEKVEWAFVIIGGILFLIIIPRLGVLWSFVPIIVYLSIVLGTSAVLWTTKLYLTEWLTPVVIVTIVWGHLIYNNFARENRLKLQIKRQFEHYLAPEMVKKLQKDPSLLRLGGETRNMTFMFCDIRGFTPISEKFKSNPAGLTKLINRFLTSMTNIIIANGGTIDKFMGDCIMAFWNAPLDNDKHRQLAVKSAIEMQIQLALLNVQLVAEGLPRINIGIGINTGEALVGNMGSDQRFDYSVIGDPVNLASRLESSSKTLGKTLIISENTMKGIEHIFPFEYIDSITVKGKTELIKVYTVKN